MNNSGGRGGKFRLGECVRGRRRLVPVGQLQSRAGARPVEITRLALVSLAVRRASRPMMWRWSAPIEPGNICRSFCGIAAMAFTQPPSQPLGVLIGSLSAWV